jgi:tyrosyl-tRNA synthetase
MAAVTDLLEDLEWRGLIAQTTDRAALAEALSAGRVTLYGGFDPTAPSLHVGNLVPLLTLRRFQLAGHRPLALVGGATGLIGDPSGRSAERSLNTDDVVADWVARIRVQVEQFLDFGSGQGAGSDALVVNNLDWTRDVSAISLLRDVGKHFSVNQMLQKESVSARLNGQGISFTEFSYMVLQSFDFLELFRRHDCTLQLGGSDQWGNITAGLDLIRKVDGVHAHGLTVPLVTKADGTKFGKTAGGAVWLDREQTSPYAFFQFWLNTDDRDVVRFLKLFTFLSHAEIDDLAASAEEKPQAREAQRALARAVTTLVHGAGECAAVEEAAAALFGRGELASLDVATLSHALHEAGSAVLDGPVPSIVDLLVLSGLCDSKGAARRTVKEGGAYLNNVRVTDDESVPSDDDFVGGRWLVLRRGKRNVAGVERSST